MVLVVPKVVLELVLVVPKVVLKLVLVVLGAPSAELAVSGAGSRCAKLKLEPMVVTANKTRT